MMINKLNQIINEIASVVYEHSDKDVSKEDIYNEYVEQVINNDYSCLFSFLWKKHRKYYFILKNQIKEEIVQ